MRFLADSTADSDWEFMPVSSGSSAWADPASTRAETFACEEGPTGTAPFGSLGRESSSDRSDSVPAIPSSSEEGFKPSAFSGSAFGIGGIFILTDCIWLRRWLLGWTKNKDHHKVSDDDNNRQKPQDHQQCGTFLIFQQRTRFQPKYLFQSYSFLVQSAHEHGSASFRTRRRPAAVERFRERISPVMGILKQASG